MMIQDDYKRAGIPMLPVVAGLAATKRQILNYSYLLVAAAVAFAITEGVGHIYMAVSIVTGAVFVGMGLRLSRSAGIVGAKSLYLYSIAYLAAIFLDAIADVLLKGSLPY